MYRHLSAYHSVLPTPALTRPVAMDCERGFESRDAEVGNAFPLGNYQFETKATWLSGCSNAAREPSTTPTVKVVYPTLSFRPSRRCHRFLHFVVGGERKPPTPRLQASDTFHLSALRCDWLRSDVSDSASNVRDLLQPISLFFPSRKRKICMPVAVWQRIGLLRRLPSCLRPHVDLCSFCNMIGKGWSFSATMIASQGERLPPCTLTARVLYTPLVIRLFSFPVALSP